MPEDSKEGIYLSTSTSVRCIDMSHVEYQDPVEAVRKCSLSMSCFFSSFSRLVKGAYRESCLGHSLPVNSSLVVLAHDLP